MRVIETRVELCGGCWWVGLGWLVLPRVCCFKLDDVILGKVLKKGLKNITFLMVL